MIRRPAHRSESFPLERDDSLARGRVSARMFAGSDTRRDCSPLKTEKCGLHTSTRRAFSAARRGLLRETFGSGRTSQRESERPRWCERSWSSRATKGTGASDEPRPGGFRSCTKELDSLGRMDGVRRFGASEGCPLNKGGRSSLLAKRINRERFSSSGEGPAKITSGWESGWGVRDATGNVRHRLVVGKAASTRDETNVAWEGGRYARGAFRGAERRYVTS